MRFCGVTRRRLRTNAATCSVCRAEVILYRLALLALRACVASAAAALTAELSQAQLRAANRSKAPAIIATRARRPSQTRIKL